MRAKRPFEAQAIFLCCCVSIACSQPSEFNEQFYLEPKPQRGGSLTVGTAGVSQPAMSWDPADWTWRSALDTGLMREQLFVGDLEHSVRRGGSYDFIAEAYLPESVLRGELAESWSWEDPLTLTINLRSGVQFEAIPGVMRARDLDADDVVFTFELLRSSPRKLPGYFDHIDTVEATSTHQVTFVFNEFNAEWAYRFGYGHYSGIVPRELEAVDRNDWRTVGGTGPFRLHYYSHGDVQIHNAKADYWDEEIINGVPYDIPFVDQIRYPVIRDEATQLTALRTGRLDILEVIRWIHVDHLKSISPELRWNKYLAPAGNFIALRIDTPPLDDLRVRRALNLAVNQQEIVERFYRGNAELMAYPQHPGFGDYFQPLREMPESVQDLFSYDPARAKELLNEAGYPDGFMLPLQISSGDSFGLDLLPLIASYLEGIGVRLRIEVMDNASFLASMMAKRHSPALMMMSGHVNPTTTLRKNFVSGQAWNPSMYSDDLFDDRMSRAYRTRDESERIEVIRELTAEILDQAPYIWLPTFYVYTAWWPWVRNYGGELRVGGQRPGPIYARVWIDQELKATLGF